MKKCAKCIALVLNCSLRLIQMRGLYSYIYVYVTEATWTDSSVQGVTFGGI